MNFLSLINDEEGATAIEYALIAALVGISIIGALTFLSGKLKSTFSSVGNAMV